MGDEGPAASIHCFALLSSPLSFPANQHKNIETMHVFRYTNTHTQTHERRASERASERFDDDCNSHPCHDYDFKFLNPFGLPINRTFCALANSLLSCCWYYLGVCVCVCGAYTYLYISMLNQSKARIAHKYFVFMNILAFWTFRGANPVTQKNWTAAERRREEEKNNRNRNDREKLDALQFTAIKLVFLCGLLKLDSIAWIYSRISHIALCVWGVGGLGGGFLCTHISFQFQDQKLENHVRKSKNHITNTYGRRMGVIQWPHV